MKVTDFVPSRCPECGHNLKLTDLHKKAALVGSVPIRCVGCELIIKMHYSVYVIAPKKYNAQNTGGEA